MCAMLTLQAVSTNGPIQLAYILEEYFDEQTDSPVNGLLYEDTVFTDCSIYYIGLTQSTDSTMEDQVCTHNRTRSE